VLLFKELVLSDKLKVLAWAGKKPKRSNVFNLIFKEIFVISRKLVGIVTKCLKKVLKALLKPSNFKK
jgi:hypothetical protein